jgi:hypothetical protein
MTLGCEEDNRIYHGTKKSPVRIYTCTGLRIIRTAATLEHTHHDIALTLMDLENLFLLEIDTM